MTHLFANDFSVQVRFDQCGETSMLNDKRFRVHNDGMVVMYDFRTASQSGAATRATLNINGNPCFFACAEVHN
jgi:hypothetical protein